MNEEVKKTIKNVVVGIGATAITAAVSAVAWKLTCAAWNGCQTLGRTVAGKIVGSGRPNDK